MSLPSLDCLVMLTILRGLGKPVHFSRFRVDHWSQSGLLSLGELARVMAGILER
jgi:hypothetical protein